MDLTHHLRIWHPSDLDELFKGINYIISRFHDLVYDLIMALRQNSSVAGILFTASAETNTGFADTIKRMMTIIQNEERMKENMDDAGGQFHQIQEQVSAISGHLQNQSAAVTQSSAAVEELIASLRSIAHVVEQFEGFNNQIETESGKSKSTLTVMVQLIGELSRSVDEVKGAVDIIRDVADRSSILSMNAAIQAARAGESGKGFSVVASELRKLSEQAGTNASSVASSLGLIMDRIIRTKEIADSNGKLFDSMFESFRVFGGQLRGVNGSLTEMGTGTDEVLKGLALMNSANSYVHDTAAEISNFLDPFGDLLQQLKINNESNSLYAKNSSEVIQTLGNKINAVSDLSSDNQSSMSGLQGILKCFSIIDLSVLKSVDGQPLIPWSPLKKTIPVRPSDPSSFDQYDSRHWYDFEFAGWNLEKQKVPSSRIDGPSGKRVAYLLASSHTKSGFVEAIHRGAEKIAGLFDIKLDFYEADFDKDLQTKQVEEVVKGKYDLAILQPVDAVKGVMDVKQFYQAGIPVIGSLQSLETEAWPYLLSYTGPDDWGQARLMAKAFAQKMGHQGGYAILQHVPGSGTDYGRTFGSITELKLCAPQMEFLSMMYPDFSSDKSCEMTKAWIGKYGDKLKGLIAGDDNDLMIGVRKALAETGRSDIIVAAFGNSKVGMDLVKQKTIQIMTYQSAESNGALPLEVAIDFFNGLDIHPMHYLPVSLIKTEEINSYYPPQF